MQCVTRNGKEVVLAVIVFSVDLLFVFLSQMVRMADRASTSVGVNQWLSRVKPMTLKLVFTASLLNSQHQWDRVENKSAAFLVALLKRAFSKIFPS